jgi:antitoxin HicB
MVDVSRYPIHAFWSEEDAGFITAAHDLPGCSAWGATQVEAVREMEDAIAAWIEAMSAAGNPIPRPSKVARALHA